MAAEVALQDEAILRAVEQRAPLLELEDAVGGFLRVQLRHAPVVQELAAAHGVAEVDLPVVLLPDVAHRRRDPALGHHGVRLAEKGLADERGLGAHGVRLDRRAQAGTASTDHDDVVVVGLVLGHQVRSASARRLMARSHMRRMKALPRLISRQYAAKLRRDDSSVAKTRVSVDTSQPPSARGVTTKFMVASA